MYTIYNIDVAVNFNGEKYSILGVDSVNITSNLKASITYARNRTGQGIKSFSGGDTPDTVELVCTYLDLSVSNALKAIFSSDDRCSLIVSKKQDAEQLIILSDATIADANFMTVIDEAVGGKFSIVLEGKLGEVGKNDNIYTHQLKIE